MCGEALQSRLLQFHFQSRLRRIQGRVQQAMDVPAYGAQRIRFRVETEDNPFLVVIVDGLVDIQERYLVGWLRKVRAPYARSRLNQARLLQLQKDLADDDRIHAGAAVKRTLTFIIRNLTIVACVHTHLGLFVEHSRRHVQVIFAGVVRKFLLHGALECRRVHVLEGDILHHLQVLDFCTCIFQIFHRVV